MDDSLFFYHSKTKASFYVWITAYFLLASAALYKALRLESIPNISLVCYGLALLCVWQILSNIFFLFLSDVSKEQSSLFVRLALLFVGLFLLYTSIVSAASTFWLFPHPWLPRYLALALYVVGCFLALFFCALSYILWHSKSKARIASLLEAEQQRRNNIQKWLQKAEAVIAERSLGKPKDVCAYLQKAESSLSYEIDIYRYISKRILYVFIWLSIPTWIFIIIPSESYNAWAEIPLPYQIGMVATVLWAVGWSASLINRAISKYTLSERGMLIRSLFGPKAMVWEEVKAVHIEEDGMKLQRQGKSSIKIAFAELNDPVSFFDQIQKFLPLSILFISQAGKKLLSSISRLDLANFVGKYEQACYAVEHACDSISKNNISNKKKSKK